MIERVWPPSTLRQAPVTHEARGEARNATTFATSSGRPKRPKAIVSSTLRWMASGIGVVALLPAAAGPGDRARRHRVDADVVFRQVQGHRLRVAVDGRLHRVVLRCAARLAPEDRADVHDRPAAPGPQVRHRGARGAHRREQIEAEHALPEGVVLAAERGAHVVDQDVEPAEGRHGFAYHAIDIGGDAHVGDDGDRPARPGGVDRGARALQHVGPAGTDGDVGALGGEGEGAVLADPLRRGRDQGALAAKSQIHGGGQDTSGRR